MCKRRRHCIGNQMLESPWHPPRPSTSSRRRVSGTLAGPIGVELFERGSVEVSITGVPRLSVFAELSPHLRHRFPPPQQPLSLAGSSRDSAKPLTWFARGKWAHRHGQVMSG